MLKNGELKRQNELIIQKLDEIIGLISKSKPGPETQSLRPPDDDEERPSNPPD